MTGPGKCDVCGLLHLSIPCQVPALRHTFRGVALTERDEQLLRWLAGWSVDTVEALISLVERAREQSPPEDP